MAAPLVFGKTLWENRNGFVEIRALKGNIVVSRDFYEWPAQSQTFEDRVLKLAPYNVYAGILLRRTKSGTATDCESPVRTVWADLDKKSGATFKSVLAALLPDPTMVVDSGHGWHLYWSLEQGISHADAEAIMRGIALEYGGDSVGDVARIMRVPGSFNVKQVPSIGARIIHLDNTLVKPSDFSPVYGPVFRPMAHGGTMARGTRSEAIFAAVIDWIKQGLTDDEVYDKLMTETIGEKVQEMKTDKRRRDWVNLTLRNARNV